MEPCLNKLIFKLHFLAEYYNIARRHVKYILAEIYSHMLVIFIPVISQILLG